MFGSKTGNRGKIKGLPGADRIADVKIAVARQADDVAGICFFHHLALVGEKFIGDGQADGFAQPGMVHHHVTLETAAANAQESHAVPMFGIHVGLNFEDEAGEFVVDGVDTAVITRIRARPRSKLHKIIQK